MSVTPKRPKGPPLNAMRAFEAAARHESFVAAGEDLNVTPGAISQHIKTLESWTGMPLFCRSAQGVELTEAGKSLVSEFTSAFDGVASATRALQNLKPNADFHIAALPSVAQLWLPKRLSKVRAHLPQINFSVTALEEPPSLSRELFDMSIFFGVPDGHSDQICVFADVIAPVCAPALGVHGAGLYSATLLHDLTWANDWAFWSETTSVPLKDPESGPQFSLYSLAVEEAKAGAGVLMGHKCLIEEALVSGLLVPAHEKYCDTGRSLLIDLPHQSRRRPQTDQVVGLLSS